MKFSKTIAVFAFAVLFALTGCSSNSKAKKVKGPGDLDPIEFKKMMDNNEFTAIDVRKFEERYSDNIFPDLNRPYGFIPNTPLNIDWKSSDFESKVAKLDKNKPYGLYCRSGHRSGLAKKKMESMGFKHVYNLFGGMKAWLKAGLPNEVLPKPAN